MFLHLLLLLLLPFLLLVLSGVSSVLLRLRLPSGSSMSAVLVRWFMLVLLRRFYKHARAAAKKRQKAKLDTILSQAREAARVGDKHVLHKCVRCLSPKTPKHRMQLRSDLGNLHAHTGTRLTRGAFSWGVHWTLC